MPTKHHAIRLSDADWQRLADALRPHVDDAQRPPRARSDSQWWIVETLRMIADGRLIVVRRDE